MLEFYRLGLVSYFDTWYWHLWLVPYMQTTYANLYNRLKDAPAVDGVGVDNAVPVE